MSMMILIKSLLRNFDQSIKVKYVILTLNNIF